MTLRESLGGDAQRIYEEIDTLLDSEDGVLVLFDGARMVSYTHGFGVSPCQLELLNIEIERAVRSVVGGQPATTTKDRSVAHGRGLNVGFGDAAGSDRSGAEGDRLRFPKKPA